MQITYLNPEDITTIEQVALILLNCVGHLPSGYPTLEAAVEEGKTALSGINLYPNVWEHIAAIQNLRQHPYEFYQKCGFVIVGVMPDANGLGKPDIYMAKRR